MAEQPILNSAYCFLSCLKMHEISLQAEQIMDDTFGDYFTDPTGWEDILAVFGTFGSFKNQSNATLSKPDTTGDGGKLPWAFSTIGPSAIIQACSMCNAKSMLSTSVIDIDYDSLAAGTATNEYAIWDGFFKAFEMLFNLYFEFSSIFITVSRYYKTQTVIPVTAIGITLSPAQLSMIYPEKVPDIMKRERNEGGGSAEGFEGNFQRIAWDTFDYLFPEIKNKITDNCVSLFGTLPEINYELTENNFEVTLTAQNILDESAPLTIPENYEPFHMVYCIKKPDETGKTFSVPSCFHEQFGHIENGNPIAPPVCNQNDATNPCEYHDECRNTGFKVGQSFIHPVNGENVILTPHITDYAADDVLIIKMRHIKKV